jgi:putative SOS response-associated peptidase YedK
MNLAEATRPQDDKNCFGSGFNPLQSAIRSELGVRLVRWAMCGRYTLANSRDELFELFDLPIPDEYQPRYNIAVHQQALIKRLRPSSNSAELVMSHWSLVPANMPGMAEAKQYSTFNAKSETAFESRMYRRPARQQRCLVPSSGFYEWQPRVAFKQPYLIGLEGPFCMAGIWDYHERLDLLSFSIMTTEANPLVAAIHTAKPRMPVILRPEHHDLWLDPNAPLESIRALCVPFPEGQMRAYPVSRTVGNVKNEWPELMSAIEEG